MSNTNDNWELPPLSADEPERAKKAQETFNKYAESHWKKLTDEVKRKRNKDKKDNIMASVIGWAIAMVFIIPIAVVLFCYTCWASGYVLMHLWNWFMLPFVDKPLTLYHAIGIAILVNYLTHQPERIYTWYKSQEEEIPFGKRAVYTSCLVAGPWLTLLAGYIVHRLMQ